VNAAAPLGRVPEQNAFLNRTQGAEMNGIRIVAIVLIVAGALALLYGGFSYTKDTAAVKLGPIELSVKEKKSVDVPMWAGIGAIVVGGLLLVLGGKKR
jgi:TRAP-type C4-dicarboxylate transport system permease small subunit